MTYRILITLTAQKQLASFPAKLRERIDKRILALAENPRPNRSKPLRGKKYQDVFRLRVGDYRIIYRVEHDRREVLVIRIGHRRGIYRNP